MIVRHKIWTVDEGAGGTCTGFDAAVSAMGTSNVACLVQINGVTVLNTTDVKGLVTSTVPVNCGNGIICMGYRLANTHYLTIDIDGIDIGNAGINYLITVTHPLNDYYVFSNTFKLFGYDLGNNTTAGITTNPDTDIYLVEKPGGSQSGFARCVPYRIPGTAKIYVFNTHSSASQGNEVITYTVDGVAHAKIGGTDNMLYDPSSTDKIALIQIATAPANICNHTFAYEGRCSTTTWVATYNIDDVDFEDYEFEVNGRDCLNYVLTNYSYYPDSKNVNGMDVLVYQYVSGVWTALTTLAINNLGNGSSSSMTFTEDGTYKLVVSFQVTLGLCTKSDYVFQIGCNTLECITDKLEDLLCCCRTDTCVDRDYYIYNYGISLMGILWMYRWESQELIDNSGTTPLTSTDFAELSEMFEDLYNGTYRFCNSCLNSCSDKVNVVNTCF